MRIDDLQQKGQILSTKKRIKRCDGTALQPEGGVDSQDEYHYEVQGVQNQAERHAEPCPLAAGDAQLSSGDDVGDIARDEHAAGDEQAVEGSVDLL